MVVKQERCVENTSDAWKTRVMVGKHEKCVEITRDAWKNTKDACIVPTLTPYCFSLTTIFLHLGDCKMILNETECLEKYYSAGCYWSGGSCVNKGSLAELPECPRKSFLPSLPSFPSFLPSFLPSLLACLLV